MRCLSKSCGLPNLIGPFKFHWLMLTCNVNVTALIQFRVQQSSYSTVVVVTARKHIFCNLHHLRSGTDQGVVIQITPCTDYQLLTRGSDRWVLMGFVTGKEKQEVALQEISSAICILSKKGSYVIICKISLILWDKNITRMHWLYREECFDWMFHLCGSCMSNVSELTQSCRIVIQRLLHNPYLKGNITFVLQKKNHIFKITIYRYRMIANGKTVQ